MYLFIETFTKKLCTKFVATCYRYVYMSELGGKRLSVYIRKSDNSLTLTQVRRVIRYLRHKRDNDSDNYGYLLRLILLSIITLPYTLLGTSIYLISFVPKCSE